MKPPVDGPPTSIEECVALQAWAEAQPLTREVPATKEQIGSHLEFMAATLPTKNLDDESGRRRFAVYVRLLDGFSNAAIGYMAHTACSTMRWFPPPVDCLDLARSYRPPPGERDKVLRLCHDFMHSSFERWIENVREGQPVGDVPDRWKRIAVEQGVMRRLQDGSFVSRALYQGPQLPYAAPAPLGRAAVDAPLAE